MKIRSITYFCDPGWPLNAEVITQAEAFNQQSRLAFSQTGYELESTRLACPPFPRVLPDLRAEVVIEYAQALESTAIDAGFDYIAIGPAVPEIPESYTIIPEVLSATDNVFAAGHLTRPAQGVDLAAVRACAEVIQKTSTLDPNGFGNLYFTALANVPSGTPFFPAAYHSGGAPTFAIATEAADLAVTAFRSAETLPQAQNKLMASIQSHAEKLTQHASRLSQTMNVPFGGIDFSLAPFPTADQSLGTAMQALGVPQVGLHGSLAAAALLTDAVDRVDFPRVGFSGLMIPVLEDVALAEGAASGTLTIKDLLLYSAVCGTGLDTVPLPGDSSVDQIATVLLDLAVLAVRLDKPLTARLMPIPGKSAGDETEFEFDYFANSRVMSLQAEALEGIFGGEGNLYVTARNETAG